MENSVRYKQIQTRENYDKLLKSGMFWEFHPELSGTWEDDEPIIHKVTLTISERLSKLKEHMESPEGVTSMKLWADKLEREDQIQKYHFDKFDNRFNTVDKFGDIIEKLKTKYESNDYYRHWIKRGIESPSPLLWFIFAYVREYGKPASDVEFDIYSNDFTSSMYTHHGYIFNLMQGQGSALHVNKMDTFDDPLLKIIDRHTVSSKYESDDLIHEIYVNDLLKEIRETYILTRKDEI